MRKLFFPLLSLFWAVLIFRLTTTPQLVVTEEFWLQNLLMMSAHFIFFGIQSLLLYSSFPNSRFKPLYSIVLTSAYGAFIEYLQLTVPGRSADPFDWLLDTLGALVFLAIMKRLGKQSE